jgi:hypothetical protein
MGHIWLVDHRKGRLALLLERRRLNTLRFLYCQDMLTDPIAPIPRVFRVFPLGSDYQEKKSLRWDATVF